MEFYENLMREACKDFRPLIESNKPYWISRIGGSDFDTINKIYNNGGNVTANIINNSKIYQLNGYYDLTSNKIENFKKYYDLYMESLQYSDIMTVGNKVLTTILGLEPNKNKQKHILVNRLNIKYHRYSCIEHVVNQYAFLFQCGSLFKDKKVLLISPFGNVMKEQYDNKKDFLFEEITQHPLKVKSLDFLNTYITYNSNRYNKNLPHSSFLESLDDLKNKLKEKDFDVAFLSCGAYTMPLGLYIKKELNKQAVYIGGVMQLFFGIKGQRFQNAYCKKNKYWIDAPKNMLCDEFKTVLSKSNGTENWGRAYF